MDTQTILQLNNLNKHFYQTTAEEFDNSRQYYWDGWNRLLPIIRENTPVRRSLGEVGKILDVGCGNARFAKFLAENLKQDFEYTGIDNSEELLQKAKETLSSETRNLKLETFDIIESLLEDSFAQRIEQKYHVIVLFGVMHHIPSFELRKKLIETLAEKLEPNGILVFTAWQFANEERFQDRIIEPEKVELKKDELEENDYILDWRRGEKAFRHCHFIDEKEVQELAKEIPQVKIIDQFYADGKSGKLNLYTILSKINS